jgi:hypothetical protein
MLRIRTDRKVYGRNDVVLMTLVLRNESQETRVYEFRTTQRFDVRVTRDGRKVWQWSDDRMFAQVLSTLRIAPGDERVFKVEWKLVDSAGRHVSAGVYVIETWIVGTKEKAVEKIVVE